MVSYAVISYCSSSVAVPVHLGIDSIPVARHTAVTPLQRLPTPSRTCADALLPTRHGGLLDPASHNAHPLLVLRCLSLEGQRVRLYPRLLLRTSACPRPNRASLHHFLLSTLLRMCIRHVICCDISLFCKLQFRRLFVHT